MATTALEHAPAHHEEATGLWSWITTVDHKRIGIMYGLTAFLFFLIGGLEALVIRMQLWGPDGRLVSAEVYNQLFTMHGTTMIFLVVMPLSAMYFNYLIPLQLGARDVNREPIALGDLLEEARAFADIEARRTSTQIVVDLPENLPKIVVDSIMIEQVLLNLVRNGIEAMHDTRLERRRLDISAHQIDARWLQVEIADQGHGLLDEDVEKIFAPFYTTKQEGMGIGLAICRSIVEFHQGRLWVEPGREGGTRFRFTVPIEEDEDE